MFSVVGLMIGHTNGTGFFTRVSTQRNLTPHDTVQCGGFFTSFLGFFGLQVRRYPAPTMKCIHFELCGKQENPEGDT